MTDFNRHAPDDDSQARRSRLLADFAASMHSLVEQFTVFLHFKDPIGISARSSCDRYEKEAGEIVKRFFHCKSEEDASIVLHDIFLRAHGGAVAGSEAEWSQLGSETWSLWKRAMSSH